jgi:hypothetical protein
VCPRSAPRRTLVSDWHDLRFSQRSQPPDWRIVARHPAPRSGSPHVRVPNGGVRAIPAKQVGRMPTLHLRSMSFTTRSRLSCNGTLSTSATPEAPSQLVLFAEVDPQSERHLRVLVVQPPPVRHPSRNELMQLGLEAEALPTQGRGGRTEVSATARRSAIRPGYPSPETPPKAAAPGAGASRPTPAVDRRTRPRSPRSKQHADLCRTELSPAAMARSLAWRQVRFAQQRHRSGRHLVDEDDSVRERVYQL